jgi:hypothetical protein
MGHAALLPHPSQDVVGPGVRARYLALAARYHRHCKAQTFEAFPPTPESVESFMRYLLDECDTPSVAGAALCAINRCASDMGMARVRVNRDLKTRLRKYEQRLRDVQPFFLQVALKFYLSVLSMLSCRLILRPGKIGFIHADNVVGIEGGTFVKLVVRKNNKVIWANPWHFVECVQSGVCVACEVARIAQGVKEYRNDSNLFEDSSAMALKRDHVKAVFVVVVCRAGEKDIKFDTFTGKSARVGGAMQQQWEVQWNSRSGSRGHGGLMRCFDTLGAFWWQAGVC